MNPSSVADNCFELGLKFLRARNYILAADSFKNAIINGHVASYFQVGNMYFDGKYPNGGGGGDGKMALVFWLEGAERNDMNCQEQVSWCYNVGYAVDVNHLLADYWENRRHENEMNRHRLSDGHEIQILNANGNSNGDGNGNGNKKKKMPSKL